MNPRNAEAYNYLGYMYAEKGIKLDEAMELIKRSLEFQPDNGAFIDSLGWVYYQKGMVDEAVEQLERAASIISDDPIGHDHLGDAYARREELVQAIEQWRKALALDPGDAEEIRNKIEDAETRMKEDDSIPKSAPQNPAVGGVAGKDEKNRKNSQ